MPSKYSRKVNYNKVDGVKKQLKLKTSGRKTEQLEILHGIAHYMRNSFLPNFRCVDQNSAYETDLLAIVPSTPASSSRSLSRAMVNICRHD